MELTIKDRNSWHYRLYRRLGINTNADWYYSRRENLCHYVQMVLLSMVIGLLGAKVWRKIRVWMIVTAIASGVAIGAGLAYYPEITKRILGLLALFGFSVAALLSCILWLAANSDQIDKFFERHENWFQPIADFFSWAFSRTPRWRFWLVMIITTATATAVGCLLLGETILGIIAYLAFVILACAFFVAIYTTVVIGIPNGVNAIREKLGWKQESSEPGFTRLVSRAWDAKKGTLICPFIKLPPNWYDERD